MEQDLHAGMPISAFLARYNGRNFVFPPPVTNPPISNEVARKHIGMLQRARVGKFRYVRPDAPLREMPMPIVPKECHDISWDDGLGRKSGADPYLVFGLPRTAFVYGIRLTYVVEHLKGSAPIRVSWSRTDRHEVAVAESSLLLNVETAKEQVTTIPVNDSIDRYRIELDSPTSSIRISKIMLILPPPLTVQR
jgi:hypothetical protein